ncbi:MAG TPA: ATP-binding protein, partial [Thermoanaerobaculia bacterium]|nr:ATP-binding protein [Thermoanaerobaculia bacterium]
MKNPEAAHWLEANQCLLVAELARLKARLGGEEGPGAGTAELEALRAAVPGVPAIDYLSERFGLSAFER